MDEKGISIPIPTPKSPLFNYILFIQTLSFYEMERIVRDALILVNQHTSNNEHLILQELLRAFMNQISSLKVLDYHSYSYLRMIKTIRNIPFVSFPGAKDCLTELFEFRCNSNISSDHLYQLSQIRHNIQTLVIILENGVSDELKDLISSQHF